MLKKNMADKQMDTLKKVFCYIKKYRGYLILSVFLAALTVISTLYIPILIGDAIDFIIDEEYTWNKLPIRLKCQPLCYRILLIAKRHLLHPANDIIS